MARQFHNNFRDPSLASPWIILTILCPRFKKNKTIGVYSVFTKCWTMLDSVSIA